jgi:hypothetical protein
MLLDCRWGGVMWGCLVNLAKRHRIWTKWHQKEYCSLIFIQLTPFVHHVSTAVKISGATHIYAFSHDCSGFGLSNIAANVSVLRNTITTWHVFFK